MMLKRVDSWFFSFVFYSPWITWLRFGISSLHEWVSQRRCSLAHDLSTPIPLFGLFSLGSVSWNLYLLESITLWHREPELRGFSSHWSRSRISKDEALLTSPRNLTRLYQYSYQTHESLYGYSFILSVLPSLLPAKTPKTSPSIYTHTYLFLPS